MSHHPNFCRRGLQQGVTLIVSLIFMIVLTLFVTAGVRSTLMQERMSGYSWEQNMAFQAAEFATRMGEDYIATISPPPTSMSSTCLEGKCSRGNMPDWSSSATWSAANSTKYVTVPLSGSWANIDPALAESPKYIVEHAGSAACLKGCEGGKTEIYRVMARGVGKSATSQTVIVSAYQP